MRRKQVVTPEYNALQGIKRRCYNLRDKYYHAYGGRGITLCEEWRKSSRAFLDYVGPRPSPEHSIERIDNDGNYEPGNVRWATPIEQARNKRTNRLITIDGETRCVAEWADTYGLDRGTFWSRLRVGVDPKTALLAPLYNARRRDSPCDVDVSA